MTREEAVKTGGQQVYEIKTAEEIVRLPTV